MVAAGAMMAVPQGRPPGNETSATDRAQLVEERRGRLWTAIDRYRIEHGALPGRAAAVEAASALRADLLVRQLTRTTDPGGRVAPVPEPEYPFGPYLPHGLPANPMSGLSTVRFAGSRAAATGSAGWIIDPVDGRVRPDIPEERQR